MRLPHVHDRALHNIHNNSFGNELQQRNSTNILPCIIVCYGVCRAHRFVDIYANVQRQSQLAADEEDDDEEESQYLYAAFVSTYKRIFFSL